jgi:hypothetical protein
MFRFRGARFVASATLALAMSAAAISALAAGDDHAAAESALREVDSSPKKGVAAEPAARARAALERGRRMRSAGDESHARLADSLARRWAEAARDVAKAATVEESAAAARRGATDAGVVADRERALLEEAVAQSGRLRAQLESMDKTKEQPARTSIAANSDAGTRPAPKPAPRAADGGAGSAPRPAGNEEGLR